ncbi:TlpA disulfide reductase family protein [Pseudomonas sp. CFBP 13727]|uniref:TlpA disulfide reductase family protein n=1 Tax=Pseudomonas sp. CFBP 13727 TaxID=2775295 RepID=UPI0017873A1A|nr:TlpA disulfide reductase family protein [Pseudomonas sp. CFBP 13727]MBD8622207.1 TlpA family protein disulfide reductase [Pseudomonas sp. CFBP 13727]
MLSLAVGPFALSLHHLLILLALGLASLVGWQLARKGFGSNPEALIFRLFLLCLVVARGAFVLRYWAQYRQDLWQIPDIRDGGFLLWPGLLVSALVALVCAWRRPSMRRTLGWSLASGLLFWTLASVGSHGYQQARHSQLPEVTLHTATGQPVALRSYDGKPMVINLWASWCPPCRREMPVLLEMQKLHPEVRFLFVNHGETAQIVASFAGTTGLDLTQVLFDSQGELGRALGSVALPTTLFYSSEGKLLGSHLGELSKASLQHALETFPAQ